MEEQGRMRAMAVAVASLALILVLVTVGLTHAQAAADDREPDGREGGETGAREADLETDGEIGFQGKLTARVGEGRGAGLLARWSDPGGVELEAERLHVRTEVVEGERVSLPSGDEVWRDGTQEAQSWTFEEVEVQIGAWESEGLALAEPSRQARASVEADGSQALGAIEDHTLAWLGSRGGTSEGEAAPPSYEHRLEEPTVLMQANGEGHVEGSFTVFTDGAIVSVQQGEDGEEVWRNWTGIRWEQTAPNVEEYELRITLLKIQEGRLSIDEDAASSSEANTDDASHQGGEVSLLGEEMILESQGRIQADEVDGLVETGNQAYLLDEGSVLLSGEARGIAHPSSEPTVEGERGGGGEEARSPFLSFVAEGELSVLASEGEPLTTLSSSDEGGDGLGLAFAMVPLVLVILLGVVAVRQPALLRPLPERWADRLYRRWENEGIAREREGEFAEAAGFYRRLVRLQPGRPMGWFLLARARLDGGEPYAAIKVLRRGRDRVDAVPLDLLELQAEALGVLGVTAAAVAVVEAIAEEDPGYALSIADRLAEEGDIAEGDLERLRRKAKKVQEAKQADKTEGGREAPCGLRLGPWTVHGADAAVAEDAQEAEATAERRGVERTEAQEAQTGSGGLDGRGTTRDPIRQIGQHPATI